MSHERPYLLSILHKAWDNKKILTLSFITSMCLCEEETRKVVRGGQREPALHIQPLSMAFTSHFLESGIGYPWWCMRNLPICCTTPKQNWDSFRFINADLLLDRGAKKRCQLTFVSIPWRDKCMFFAPHRK